MITNTDHVMPRDVAFFAFDQNGKSLIKSDSPITCDLQTDAGLQQSIRFQRVVVNDIKPPYLVAEYHDQKGDTLFIKLFANGQKTQLNDTHPAFLQDRFKKLLA